MNDCKTCKRRSQLAYWKAYYEANKEKLKARREANKEKIKEQQKAYREANKEKINEKQKAYGKAYREKLKKLKLLEQIADEMGYRLKKKSK